MQVIKDPGAKLDYKFDWSAWLAVLGDTVQLSTITVPVGLIKESESNTTTTATVWLSGGTLGETYQVVNRITTAQGRVDERTLQVVIRDR